MQRVPIQVRVGVFNCQQILTKISVVVVDIVVKKQIEYRLAWHWWNSTDLGLIDLFLCRNCCLDIIIQKIVPQAKSGKYFQTWFFFPRFGGKNGSVLSVRMQVILDSLFAGPGSAPIWGEKKGEFRDWTNHFLDMHCTLRNTSKRLCDVNYFGCCMIDGSFLIPVRFYIFCIIYLWLLFFCQVSHFALHCMCLVC